MASLLIKFYGIKLNDTPATHLHEMMMMVAMYGYLEIHKLRLQIKLTETSIQNFRYFFNQRLWIIKLMMIKQVLGS